LLVVEFTSLSVKLAHNRRKIESTFVDYLVDLAIARWLKALLVNIARHQPEVKSFTVTRLAFVSWAYCWWDRLDTNRGSTRTCIASQVAPGSCASWRFHDPAAARANLPLGTFFWLSAQ